MENYFFWIESYKGGNLPIFNRFVFHLRLQVGTKRYWKCRECACVTLVTVDDEFDRIEGEHDHIPDLKYFYSAKLKIIIKECIDNDPFLSATRIYNDSRRKLALQFYYEEDATRLFPSAKQLESYIYRLKRKFFPSVDNFFPQRLDSTRFSMENGHNLIVYEQPFITKEMIILGDIDYIKRFVLEDDFELYIDGTFNSSLESFYQLYILHSRINGQYFPLMYCFLKGKTEEIYRQLFFRIDLFFATNGIEFKPTRVMMDFEKAAYKAMLGFCSEENIYGCYFHFGQAIWRKVLELKLKSLYLNPENENFRNIVDLLSTLALVPIEKIFEAFRYIKGEWFGTEVLVDELFDYLERTWLRTTDSIFGSHMWNHFNNNGPRTNNSAEGFHSKLNRMINKTKANFYEILTYLKKIQLDNELELRRILNGGAPRIRKKMLY